MDQLRLDTEHMQAALNLARRHLGMTAPNPSVGCVIVDPKTNRVLGRGYTAKGGRPHAETQALEQAGKAARGATAYVTLEPCAHKGQTPSCAKALRKARIGRVVIAIQDPHPKTAGKGIQILRNAGIEVTEGICEAEAREVILGFLSVVTTDLPMVTLKLATSLDGRIATHTGDSKWITSPEARRAGHLLRAEHDAILVGSGTILADDPMLDCRVPGLESRSPIRVIADGRMRTSVTSRVVQTANEIPTRIVTYQCEDEWDSFEGTGVTAIITGSEQTGIDARQCLEQIADWEGVNRILVEGGSHLAASLLKAHLVHYVHWFRAPMVIGGDGLPALQALGIDKVEHGIQLELIRSEKIGDDVAEIYATKFTAGALDRLN